MLLRHLTGITQCWVAASTSDDNTLKVTRDLTGAQQGSEGSGGSEGGEGSEGTQATQPTNTTTLISSRLHLARVRRPPSAGHSHHRHCT